MITRNLPAGTRVRMVNAEGLPDPSLFHNAEGVLREPYSHYAGYSDSMLSVAWDTPDPVRRAGRYYTYRFVVVDDVFGVTNDSF